MQLVKEAEPPTKKRITGKNDNIFYVLPSARTISDYKQMQASQVERDAAMALGSKPDDVKSVLHYDTTLRNKIDGEWPSIILSFSDGRDFELRSIFFAYEDREQIVQLLVESYNRLSVACSGKYKPVSLWERTDAIMTDAVSKNLKIEDGIAECFNSTHKPFHLLCKSHTVKKLDASNLSVLSKVEALVKQRKTLESISPRLKSFFRGKKTTVEAGIDALLSLVSHDKSGKQLRWQIYLIVSVNEKG